MPSLSVTPSSPPDDDESPTTPATPRSGVSAIWRDVLRLHDASVAPREIDSIVDDKMFRDFTYLTDYPAKQVSDFMAPSEDIEDCSSVDALFGQYLRSPSPPPSPSPSLLSSPSTAYSSSPNDTASEMSGAILIDGTLDPTRSSEKSNTGLLRVPGTEDTPEKEVVQDQGATSCTGNGTRLRLRVSQPKITLRLRVRDASQTSTGKKGKKGAKKGTKPNKRQETKNKKRELRKKQKRLT